MLRAFELRAAASAFAKRHAKREALSEAFQKSAGRPRISRLTMTGLDQILCAE